MWVMTKEGSISPFCTHSSSWPMYLAYRGLSHLEREATVHRRAERDLVKQPDVNAVPPLRQHMITSRSTCGRSVPR